MESDTLILWMLLSSILGICQNAMLQSIVKSISILSPLNTSFIDCWRAINILVLCVLSNHFNKLLVFIHIPRKWSYLAMCTFQKRNIMLWFTRYSSDQLFRISEIISVSLADLVCILPGCLWLQGSGGRKRVNSLQNIFSFEMRLWLQVEFERVQIGNTTINFPFTPYPLQVDPS